MPITQIRLENFTAYQDLDLDVSPGVTVLTGDIGKTHLLKATYALCAASRAYIDPKDMLVRSFRPYRGDLQRLAREPKKKTLLKVTHDRHTLQVSFRGKKFTTKGLKAWQEKPIPLVYIPSTEMLSKAPGFLSLYNLREIAFEEEHKDILVQAFLDPLRHLSAAQKEIQQSLQKALKGTVVRKGETFFLKTEKGLIEFPLLSEGLRRIALLWLLVRNGSLVEGATLLWDMPEVGLDGEQLNVVVETVDSLQQLGVQAILMTNNDALLDKFDALRKKEVQTLMLVL